MGDSLSVLEGSTTTTAPPHQGDSLSQLEASSGPNTGAQPEKPYAPSAGKWYSGLDDVANGAIDAVKGAAKVFDPRLQPGENAITGSPAGRIVKGIVETGKQAAQVPGAIHDINQSDDPTGHYLQAAQDTASQGAGQALTAIGTEGIVKSAGSVTGAGAETAARTAGKVVRGVAEDIPIVRQATKLGKYAKEAAAETAARRAPAPTEAAPSFPSYDKASATESATPTDNSGAAPKDNASTHPDAAAFEEKFHVPIDRYIDDAGKFNTKDFLDEVVKPKTEPPNAVINKVFGNDGVQLAEKLNGKPLAKWESNAPAGEPRGGSARAAAKAAPETEAAPAGTVEKTGDVLARGYLKKVGADEGSILNGAGRTPGEHADSVNYHREQIRSGTATPAELHVDEAGNVIGADGRHRALAAIQEQGEGAKIKVRVVKHAFAAAE